jgi:hypothetical protein
LEVVGKIERCGITLWLFTRGYSLMCYPRPAMVSMLEPLTLRLGMVGSGAVCTRSESSCWVSLQADVKGHVILDVEDKTGFLDPILLALAPVPRVPVRTSLVYIELWKVS